MEAIIMVKAVGTDAGSVPNTGLDIRKKRLKESCQDFEAVMTNFVFKAMQATVSKTEKSSGGAEEVFEGLLSEAVAKDSSRHDRLGLGEALYKQLVSKIEPKGQVAPQPLRGAASNKN
jgi:Rod binding domain-containing protein